MSAGLFSKATLLIGVATNGGANFLSTERRGGPWNAHRAALPE